MSIVKDASPLPSISIVVPSYNQGEWIEHCLNSIIQQKQPGDQLIVVDGESTDDSQLIIKRLSLSIDITIIDSDQGQADALQKGFTHANGDICGYLNTDDLLLPGSLDYIRQYFKTHPETDAVYSHRIFMDNTSQIDRFWIIPFHSNYCMSRWDYIPQETCFWRCSLMRKVGGFDASLQFAMDYDLFVRMMKHGRFQRVNCFLAAFREHPRSKTQLLYETIGRQEAASIQKKCGIDFHWYDRIIGNLYGQLVLKLGLLFRLLIYPFLKNSIQNRIRTGSKT